MKRPADRSICVRCAGAAIGRIWLVALAAAIAMLFSEVGSAHEVRPAYLSVRDEAPNEFRTIDGSIIEGTG